MNFASSLAFLNKKSWHAHPNAANIRNVWSTENITDPEKKKIVQQKLEEEMNGDTNVFALSLFSLGSEKCPVMTGDPAWCSHCGSTLNSQTKMDKSNSKWFCGFCQTENELTLEEGELPQEESVDYFLKAPSLVKESETAPPLLIFCLDISGSMGRIVQGKDTRLSIIQQAILSQLSNLAESSRPPRVALITFNDKVRIYGDGLERSSHLRTSILNDQQQLLKKGKEFPVPVNLKESNSSLSKAVMSLGSSGCTSLGPALVVALGMAQNSQSSQIIVATDGLANSGIGSIEIHSESEMENVETFYANLGDMAKNQGTSISVLSIPGSDCNIEILGRLALQTSGKVDIVDVTKMEHSFRTFVENRIIARNTRFKLLLHPTLYLKNEQTKLVQVNKKKEDEKEDKMEVEERGVEILERLIGNVTEESEVTFEYGVFLEDVREGELLPIQLQITYTLPDGSERLRVVTKYLETTKDQQKAERKSDAKVMGLNLLQQSATRALNARYSDSENYLQTNRPLVERLWKVTKESDEKWNIVQEECFKFGESIRRERERDRERKRKRSRSPRGRKRDNRARSRSRSRSNSPTCRKERMRSRGDEFANMIVQGVQFNSKSWK